MSVISLKPWTVAFFFFWIITGFVRYKCEFTHGCVQSLQKIWIRMLCQDLRVKKLCHSKGDFLELLFVLRLTLLGRQLQRDAPTHPKLVLFPQPLPALRVTTQQEQLLDIKQNLKVDTSGKYLPKWEIFT